MPRARVRTPLTLSDPNSRQQQCGCTCQPAREPLPLRGQDVARRLQLRHGTRTRVRLRAVDGQGRLREERAVSGAQGATAA